VPRNCTKAFVEQWRIEQPRREVRQLPQDARLHGGGASNRRWCIFQKIELYLLKWPITLPCMTPPTTLVTL